MNAATRALATAYLALLPVAWPVLPGNLRGIDILFALFAALVLWQSRRQRPTLRPLDIAVVASILGSLPSLAGTDDLRASTIAITKQLYLAAVYVVFAIYFTREGLLPALRIVIWSALVLCLAGLGSVLLYYSMGVQLPAMGSPWPLPYIGSVLRLWAGTESAEMFGNYLTFVLPLVCAAGVASVRLGLPWIAGAIIMSAAMVLTISHALGGFIVAGLIATWSFLETRVWAPLRVGMVLVAVALIVVMNLMLVVTIRKVTSSWDHDPSVPRADAYYAMQTEAGADRLTLQLAYNPMSYFLIKKIAWQGFLERPWTGVGVGRFHTLTERAYQEGRIHEPYRAIDPHSTVLGALAERGILGGVTVIALLLAAFFAPRLAQTQAGDRWIVIALHAALAGLVVNSINVDVMNFRFLWVAFAALRALSSRTAR